MRPSPFSGHGGALGEASTEDSGRLSNTAREPWPGAAPVRVAPPAEGRLWGWEVGRQPWPGLSLGAPWEWSVTGGRKSAVRVAGEDRRGAGAGDKDRVSWPLKIFPGVQGVPVPEAAGYSHPGRGRADSAELGLVGQQRLIRKEPPSCSARRRGAPA